MFNNNRDNPNIKAIIIIRDPVERFISHYKFTIQECKNNGLNEYTDAINYLLNDGKLFVHYLLLFLSSFSIPYFF